MKYLKDATPPELATKCTHAPSEYFCVKYQIGRTTWWRMTKKDGFPTPINFGRSVRWPVDGVDSFLIANCTGV